MLDMVLKVFLMAYWIIVFSTLNTICAHLDLKNRYTLPINLLQFIVLYELELIFPYFFHNLMQIWHY